MDSFRVFDIHILEREDALQSYTQQQITRAQNHFRLYILQIFKSKAFLKLGSVRLSGTDLLEREDTLQSYTQQQITSSQNHYRLCKILNFINATEVVNHSFWPNLSISGPPRKCLVENINPTSIILK